MVAHPRRVLRCCLPHRCMARDGRYQTNNQLVVSITGGTLTSQKGNAVTVYNTEKNEVQAAQITVLGGYI